MEIPREAECKKKRLHSFVRTSEERDAYVEVCTFCGEKLITGKFEKERINNDKYYRYHFRDYLQPFGSMRKLFEEVYGRNAVREMNEIAEIQNKPMNKLWEEVKGQVKEEGKFSKKMIFDVKS